MTETIDLFREKAELVSAVVYPVPCLEAALDKGVEICKNKAPLDAQMNTADGYDPSGRILAAPNLDEEAFRILSDKCAAAGGIRLIRDGIRNYPWGIDTGLTLMDFGIADTGTLVLDSASEETRLATMLSEIHVAVLYRSKVRATALEMTEELNRLLRNPGAYTAFITGASRTADIERVLALGVHGPLELHIMLVED